MTLLRRKPWLPVLFFYLAFIGIWIWFAWFAVKHSPEVIEPPPSPHGS